ncbi:putative membrane protein [Propionispora sp. 2/2-37]|uniref:AzlD domain-containing protein n=1 Tax=Propionispora sp. 2/2-37 TaxID=1677858 RepID=UPI0006BB7B2C|nr:AzlD domain-containing protein [Propionispora sp. 2/2-37]CUH96684.1 putative membrane protein [Propionispora sp. 2/2-37]
MRPDMVILILAMAAVTYFTRAGAFAILHRTGIPVWLERWLKHIPTAVLTALIMPALLLPRGVIDISWQNHYLMAGLLAAYVAFKTNNALLTMAWGMSAMFIMRWSGF